MSQQDSQPAQSPDIVKAPNYLRVAQIVISAITLFSLQALFWHFRVRTISFSLFVKYVYKKKWYGSQRKSNFSAKDKR
jgi:hypothetical protein